MIPSHDYDDLNFQDLWAELVKKKTPKSLEILAEKIGVEVLSIQMMGCTWLEEYWAWGFPVIDNDRIVGIRLLDDRGGKGHVRGSKDGSFFVNGEIDDDIAKIIKLIE